MPRLSALAATLAAAAVAAAQPAAKDPTFRVEAKAKLTMTAGGQEQKIEADAAYEYVWKRDGKEKILLMEGIEVRAVTGGQEVMNARMNRAGFTNAAGGQKAEVKTETAPAELKRMLTDSFGAPVCKLEVDATGKEVKRTMLAGPGAAQLVDSGMVANATLFHPPYLADKDEWQAEVAVGTGNGVAAGKLTYTKVPGGKGGQAVKVSGTLSADGQKVAGGLAIKGSKYAVAGEQTYDPARKEWVAGRLTMDLAMTLAKEAQDVGSAKGEMVITFAAKPAK
jgi:hypothetical protein